MEKTFLVKVKTSREIFLIGVIFKVKVKAEDEKKTDYMSIKYLCRHKPNPSRSILIQFVGEKINSIRYHDSRENILQ